VKDHLKTAHPELNPHLWQNREGDLPQDRPDLLTQGYTNGVFEKIIVEYHTLVDNMKPTQKNAIDANPGDYLAIVPIGAGGSLLNSQKDINKKVRKPN
jgi:hypothetical protein